MQEKDFSFKATFINDTDDRHKDEQFPLIVAAITGFCIPWLRERCGSEKLEKTRGCVQIAAYTAEKPYGAGRASLSYCNIIEEKHCPSFPQRKMGKCSADIYDSKVKPKGGR